MSVVNQAIMPRADRGRLLVGVALALFCAAVPLAGNDLPIFTGPILGFFAFLGAVLIVRRHSFPSFSLMDAAVALHAGLAFLSPLYSVYRAGTEAALLWLSVCLAAYLVFRWAAEGSSLSACRVVVILAACATVIFEIGIFLWMGSSGPHPCIFSTFLNENVYGGFLASVLALTLSAPLAAGGRLAPGFRGRKTTAEQAPPLAPDGAAADRGDASEIRVQAVLTSAATAILATGLYLTFSKGAWLVAGAVLLSALIFQLARRRGLLLLGTVLAVVLGIYLGGYVDRVANRSAMTEQVQTGGQVVQLAPSVSPRLAYWRSALKIGASSPILGTGYGTFAAAHVRYARWPVYSRYAHNYAIERFAEAGAIGAGLFLLILACWLLPWVGRLRRPAGDDRARLPFVFAALAVLAHACLDITLNTPEGALWFWLLLGIANPSARPRPAPGTVGRTAAGIALAVLLAAAGLLQYRQAAVNGLVKAATARKQPGETLALLSRALRIRPYDDKALALRAATHQRNGRLDRALADFRAAARADESKQNYRLQAAYILVQMGRDDEALRLAGEAYRYNPTIPAANEGYAVVLIATGRAREGIDVLAKAVLIRPQIEIMPLEQARELLAAGCAAQGTVPDGTRLALAAVEYELGHYEQAANELKGLKASPEEGRETLARLVAQLGAKGFTVSAP